MFSRLRKVFSVRTVCQLVKLIVFRIQNHPGIVKLAMSRKFINSRLINLSLKFRQLKLRNGCKIKFSGMSRKVTFRGIMSKARDFFKFILRNNLKANIICPGFNFFNSKWLSKFSVLSLWNDRQTKLGSLRNDLLIRWVNKSLMFGDSDNG